MTQWYPPPQVMLLPTFVYDGGLRDKSTILPALGDIVKVRSDGTNLLTGECVSITKVNLAHLFVTNPPINPPRSSPSRMKSKSARTLGGAPICVQNSSPYL